ncbi:MAG: aspartate 1-decarboxylase [Alphaproteobacteria bacterium]|nr:aspartate 1-decarboxylase [Alphaproteobacteria bacterium]
MIQIIRAKLHGMRVTDANLEYQGSITLDPELCERVGIYPLEFVDIWNKSNGARIQTYVILGEPGSRCCVLNGSAARHCQPGDKIIIAAREYVTRAELHDIKPKVLTFTKDNEIDQELYYDVYATEDREFNFRIMNGDNVVDFRESARKTAT